MSSADVANVLTQLAAVERLVRIPGSSPARYVYSFATPPDVVQSTDLPAFVNLPGPMLPDYSAGSDEDGLEFYPERDYYAVLLVAPFGTGLPGEKFNEAVPYLDAVRDVFCAYQSLSTAGALRTVFKGDTGVRADIQYAGQYYYGIRFTLAVRGHVRVSYATGE